MIAGCFGQLQTSTRTEEQAEQVESESENQQMPGKVGGTRWRKLPLAVAIDVLESESESKSDGARCLSMCDVATTRSDESNGRITTELKIKCYPSNMPPKNNDDDEMATATATATRQRDEDEDEETVTAAQQRIKLQRWWWLPSLMDS